MTVNIAIIWDMDGVIVDTTDLHYKSWIAVLPKYGIEFSKETFLTTFGMNNRAIINSLMDYPAADILEEISQKKEVWFRENVPGNVELLPGVKEWLQRFKNWGFLQGIASSAPQANVSILVKETGISAYFDALESAANLPSKPDPAIFLKVASLLQTPVAQCLVIEDAPAGIEGARRAGIKCIAVTTTHPAGELCGADLVVERLDHLTQPAVKQLLHIQ
ncbi:MAG TPA: HAD family phosphatase [Anaerolineaceae bacterium]|nr:HAD family phosphatase [Anaerolineaceae bacterium]